MYEIPESVEGTPVPPVESDREIPFPSSRHPLVFALLLMCMISGLPSLLGVVPQPGSIRALLPGILGALWSLFLTVGPLVAILGIFWRKLATGISLEQIGMTALGGACVTYGFIIVYYNGYLGLQAGSLVGVFGVFCFARVAQLYRWVKKVDRLAKGGLNL